MSNKWSERFIELARTVSTWSKDPSTKVGCVIVGIERTVLATGYNGLPRRVLDLPERMERPAKYLWTSHAEENAVAQAAREGVALADTYAFVTHHPCSRCARMLIQAGVRRVFVSTGTTSMPSEEFDVAAAMLHEADVSLEVVE